MPRGVRALLLASLTLLPATALAQTDADKATARELAKEGSQALEKKDYATAADRFARADALFHAPTLVVGLARAQVGLGKLVAAQENYYAVTREPLPPNPPDAFKEALEDAKKELQAIGPQVPWVIVKITPESAAGATVTLDDAPVPPAAIGVKRALDPGDHTIRVMAKGFRAVRQPFSIAAGATQTVEIALQPAPPVPEINEQPSSGADSGSVGFFPHQKAFAITALGLGGAGVVAGVITGVLAIGKRKDLEDGGCTANGCPASLSGDLSSYRTFANVSTGTLVGGGALAAVGAVLLVVTPKAPPPAAPDATPAAPTGLRITPVIGLGQVGLFGQF